MMVIQEVCSCGDGVEVAGFCRRDEWVKKYIYGDGWARSHHFHISVGLSK